MIPQSYGFSHGLCLNNFLQLWFMCNQRDQILPFRYINQDYEVPHLVRVRKVLGDMKYLMRSVKQAAEAVGIWTKDNWDVNIMNLLYAMVSGGFNFKINRRFDSFSWSSVLRDF